MAIGLKTIRHAGLKGIDMNEPVTQKELPCVYKATTKKGETAHFGEYSAAKAWAGWGSVERIPLKTLTLIEKPCGTCEALARTVMLDQTSHDTTPPAAQPAPVQEGRDWSLLEATQESLREHMAEIKRLKEAQRQWVGLTDEEIMLVAYQAGFEIHEDYDTPDADPNELHWWSPDYEQCDDALFKLRDLIEAKLKEKNT